MVCPKFESTPLYALDKIEFENAIFLRHGNLRKITICMFELITRI